MGGERAEPHAVLRIVELNLMSAADRQERLVRTDRQRPHRMDSAWQRSELDRRQSNCRDAAGPLRPLIDPKLDEG